MIHDMITWVHLSDFHLTTSGIDRYDQNIVLKKLVKDLEAQLSEHRLDPDFVLISGDVASFGLSAEYELAHELMDDISAAVHVPKDRIFSVAGNHDVDRDNISTAAAATAEKIVSNEDKNEFRRVVREIVSSEDDTKLLLKRLEVYESFAQRYGGGPSDCDDKFSYVRMLDLGRIRCGIVGLNTAWLARGGKRDRHQIVLGEQSVRSALEAAEDADLIIALMHHPIEWLHDCDREDVEPLLLDACDFVLHGHLHRLQMTDLKGPDAVAMVIGAGASYEERDSRNAYNLVQLKLRDAVGKVILRRYSDRQGGFWTRDTTSYRNVDDGEYDFQLPDRLGAQPTRVGHRAAATEELSSWPQLEHVSGVDHIVLFRAQFVEIQLRDMIQQFGSAYPAKPIAGQLRNKANYLLRKDVRQLQDLLHMQSDPGKIWTVLRSIEAELAALSAEILDYRVGSVLREEGEDDQLCQWSDEMLREIGARTGKAWDGITVLADRDALGPNSHLVRLGFPNEGIWALPWAVHQFAWLLDTRRQIHRLMSFTEADASVLSTLTADILATHLCGPSYAFAAACRWLEFEDDFRQSPHQQDEKAYAQSEGIAAQMDAEEGTVLPLFDLRFQYIVRTLEERDGLYAPEVRWLRRAWGLQASDRPVVGPKALTGLDEYFTYFDELHKRVVLYRFDAAVDHFTEKANAKDLYEKYQTGAVVTDASLTEVSFTGIMSAAWYCRILADEPDQVESIEEFYRALLGRKALGV